jgi:hypothetical protein
MWKEITHALNIIFPPSNGDRRVSTCITYSTGGHPSLAVGVLGLPIFQCPHLRTKTYACGVSSIKQYATEDIRNEHEFLKTKIKHNKYNATFIINKVS